MQTSRQQAVVEQLREMILRDELSGGDRLLEVQLSERLGVSRTPIREALITLAEEGLVEYRSNRGYVVRSFSPQDIEGAYTVREALESLACRVLAENSIDRRMKRAFQACLDEGDELLSAPRLTMAARDPWGEINERFHELIVTGANNRALVDALARVTNIPYSSSRVVHWFEEGDVEGLFQLRLVHAQHHNIYEAICAGQGYRAETAMRGHIAFAAQHIRAKYFTSGGGDGVVSADAEILPALARTAA